MKSSLLELVVETIAILMFGGFVFTAIITLPIWGPIAFISSRMDRRKERLNEQEALTRSED